MRRELRTIWVSEPEHKVALLDRANERRKKTRREKWKLLPLSERQARETAAMGRELCRFMTDEELKAHKRARKTASQKRSRRRKGVKEKVYVTLEHKREKARLRQKAHRARKRLGQA